MLVQVTHSKTQISLVLQKNGDVQVIYGGRKNPLEEVRQ